MFLNSHVLSLSHVRTVLYYHCMMYVHFDCISYVRTAYEQAGVMAAEKSKRAFAVPSAPPRTVTFIAEEDDDADMAQSLARARRLALSQQSRNKGE